MACLFKVQQCAIRRTFLIIISCLPPLWRVMTWEVTNLREEVMAELHQIFCFLPKLWISYLLTLLVFSMDGWLLTWMFVWISSSMYRTLVDILVGIDCGIPSTCSCSSKHGTSLLTQPNLDWFLTSNHLPDYTRICHMIHLIVITSISLTCTCMCLMVQSFLSTWNSTSCFFKKSAIHTWNLKIYLW